jgi:hypothetical protein
VKRVLLLVLLLAGCAAPQRFAPVPNVALPPQPSGMPGMRPPPLPSPRSVPSVAKPPAPPKGWQGFVSLVWSNVFRVDSENILTGVEATTNLVNWTLVAELPYTNQGAYFMTNRPMKEFYRVYNRYK